MAEALECPVCLTLPEGEVHQCNEGHCCCLACWNRLDPRRCPECRQQLPQANRNKAIERAIAALAWSCQHCGEATTRGSMAAHLAACPQLPTACAAAAAGCGWAGVAAEQAAHEAACPFAICLRVVAPLQAECQELRVQNQELQRQVAALQPLAGRVRVLEGEEEEEGGRRQRQRVGPAPHDTPPSDAALEVMGLPEAVAALRAHVSVARVVEKVMAKFSASAHGPLGNEQAAAAVGAGMIEAAVEAMQAHPQVARVQNEGCFVLIRLCCREFLEEGLARRQRAAEAGAIEAVVDAMRAHRAHQVEEEGEEEEDERSASFQHDCCWALRLMFVGNDAAALARKQRAAVAHATAAVVEAMRAHPHAANLQIEGCKALTYICNGPGPTGQARKQRAADAGALEVVVGAMQLHAHEEEMQEPGCNALLSMCRDSGGEAVAIPLARRQRAAQAGGRSVAVAALQAHADFGRVYELAGEVLDLLPVLA